MSDVLSRVRKAAEKAKVNKDLNVVSKRKVFSKFKDCEDCKGTLQLDNGKPCACRKKMIMQNILKECGIKEAYYNVNFEFYDDMLYDAEVRTSKGLKLKPNKRIHDISYFANYLRLYIDTFENRINDGRGFIISGNCGGAKTGGASLIIKELAMLYYKNRFSENVEDRKHSFFFIETNDLLDLIFDSWDKESDSRFDSKEKLRKTKEADLLVIDDMGAEYTKNEVWIINIFLKLIKGRKSENKATILTTNYSPEQLVERFSEEMFPRLSSVLTEAMEVIIVDNPVDVRDRIAESRSLMDDMKREVKSK